VTFGDFSDRLQDAVERHDFESIVVLVREGASPDWALGNGETLLIHAVSQGQGALVATLIELGASANLADPAGDTPLIHAARHNMHDILEDLLTRGADPLKLNLRGESAAHTARISAKNLSLAPDDNNVDPEQVAHEFSRFQRIALRLDEAEAEARECRAIAQCHEGLFEPLPVPRPLQFKPAPPGKKR
jgi:hypothetical protein